MRRHRSSGDTQVGELTVDAVTIPLYFDGKRKFWATVGEDVWEATSMDALREKTRKALRTEGKRPALLATLAEEADDGTVEIADVILIGKEARRSGGILYSVEGDAAGSLLVLHRYASEHICPRLTDAQKAQARAVVKTAYKAEQARKQLWERLSYDDVDEAIEKAKLALLGDVPASEEEK